MRYSPTSFHVKIPGMRFDNGDPGGSQCLSLFLEMAIGVLIIITVNLIIENN
jgi:hypothetical protein